MDQRDMSPVLAGLFMSMVQHATVCSSSSLRTEWSGNRSAWGVTLGQAVQTLLFEVWADVGGVVLLCVLSNDNC